MFDREKYRHACAQLTLGQEKLEEIIAMTEHTAQKKRLNRSMKTILIAAACLAALTVTAMAAPAVQQLFTTFTITYRSADSQRSFTLPQLKLEERDGRSILSVDEVEIDVTDAFAQNGQYDLVVDGASLTVKPDGWVSVQMAGDEESGDITYSYNLHESTHAATGIAEVDPEDRRSAAETDAFGSYSVSVDENGQVVVAESHPIRVE